MTRRKPAALEPQLPVAEVAALWRCSRQHVYNLICRREIEAVQLGAGRAKTRIPQSAALAFIARNTTPARGATH